MKKYFMLIALVISVLFLSGCSSYGSTPANTQTNTQPASANEVIIANFAFSPAALNIKVGTTVTWTNKDTTTHTVTSDSNGVFNGNVSPGATFSFTFTQAGTFNYHCNIHPSMTGSIVVGP